MVGEETTQEQRSHLDAGKQWMLAILCLCGGIAPLAARWLTGDVARIAYGLVVAAVLLALTLLARRSPAVRRFWQLSFAFFVFAVVQVLNNSIPRYVGVDVMHQPPTSGNPLASTIAGSIGIQLLDTAIAIVPIVLLTVASGQDLGSIYARRGQLGRALVIAIVVFAAFYVVTARIPLHRLFPTNGVITPARYLALTPALLVLVLSNGFQEEFLFRGLFLRKYNSFFGIHVSNLLQAAVFVVAHAGVTYTPVAIVFLIVFVFPLGLLCGYLMRISDGVLAPAIFHAGADIPIYLAFLTFVS